MMAGFTLTNGVADDGGGVSCESSAVLSNCVLTGNAAFGVWYFYFGPIGGEGGGAADSTLKNCVLSGNTANGIFNYDFGYVGGVGGGAHDCTLNNCTLNGNSAMAAGLSTAR